MRNDYYDQCGENGEFLSIHDAVLWCKEQLQVWFKHLKVRNLFKNDYCISNLLFFVHSLVIILKNKINVSI